MCYEVSVFWGIFFFRDTTVPRLASLFTAKLVKMDYIIKNQTKLNQSKPNQTCFPLNAKFSAISYPIFINLGMVISIT